MEHRRFLQRLDELVAELTHAQAEKVIAALQQRGDGDEVQRILDQRLEEDPKGRTAVRAALKAGAGERNGLPRSRCLDRQRTSNLLTGSAAGAAAQEGALARLYRGAQSIAAGAQGRQGVQSEQEHRLQVAPSFSKGAEPIERSVACWHRGG